MIVMCSNYVVIPCNISYELQYAVITDTDSKSFQVGSCITGLVFEMESYRRSRVLIGKKPKAPSAPCWRHKHHTAQNGHAFPDEYSNSIPGLGEGCPSVCQLVARQLGMVIQWSLYL